MKHILSAGHGGPAWGHYLIAGKQFKDLKEGEFNRDIIRMMCLLEQNRYLNLVPGPIRVPLMSRVRFVNKLAKREDVMLIDIHANATAKPGWDKARGHRVFVQKKADMRSIALAESFNKNLQRVNLEWSPKDIRERDFTMLKRTHCPSVLIELGFMNNKEDYYILRSQWGRRDISVCCHDAIQEFEASLLK